MTSGLTIVKIGGASQQGLTGTEPALKKLFSGPTVLLHGGGPEVSQVSQRLGLTPTFVDGLRVTDSATLECVEMVLSGLTNGRLVRQLQRGGWPAFGLSGLDGRVLEAELHPDERFGRVGVNLKVRTAPLWALLRAGFLPVLTPLALGPDGGSLNVNGDTAAAAVACSLKAERLVLLTDVPGLLGPDGRTIEEVSFEAMADLLRSGVVSGGMIPKLEAAAQAVSAGVESVEIRSLKAEKTTVIRREPTHERFELAV